MFTNAAAYTNAHHLAESVDGPDWCPDDVSASVRQYFDCILVNLRLPAMLAAA